MENRPRYRVPDELRETLLDFTIAYLLERPTNLPEFGLNFFQRLRGEGGGGNPSAAANDQAGRAFNGGNDANNDTELPDHQVPVRNVGRRKSVFAEAYDPEEDKDDKPSVS